jgi:cytochrome c6
MLLPRIASACAAAVLAACAAVSPVHADLANGAAIFEAKCAACHAQGGNILAPGKTLQLEALQRNGYASAGAQVELYRNGKGQMPKYQGAIPKVSRLTDEELQDVAAFVLKRADEKWL